VKKKISIDAPHLWLVLARCHRALSQIAERSIQDTGLGLTDFAALEALLHKGPLTITDIQSKVPLALGSMTAAVDRLEKKGLILRTPSREDRRAKVLKLSPKGRAVVEAAFRCHAADLETVMAVLDQREKQQLHDLLKRVGLFAATAAGARSSRARANLNEETGS
jgi:MarR family transcriptional regulator, 2-MHQ and catechol-resistance regulon repressor